MPLKAQTKDTEAQLAAMLYYELRDYVATYSPAVVMAAITGTLYRIAAASGKTVDQVCDDLKQIAPILGDPEDAL